jgi:hypothetical protein
MRRLERIYGLGNMDGVGVGKVRVGEWDIADNYWGTASTGHDRPSPEGTWSALYST